MKLENRSDDISYTVLCQDILALKTNVAHFRSSFGQNAPASSPLSASQCQVCLSLMVHPNTAFQEVASKEADENWGKYHFLSGKHGGDLVFYQRPFVLGSKLYLEASSLTGPEPLIRVNRDYLRLVHFRFMNLHSASFIITDLAVLLLLRKQLAPIHCSAFKKGDQTVVVFAPSNTGKTITTMMACLELEGSFISEDLAITDGHKIHGLPWTSTFRYYGSVDTRLLARLKRRATSALPFLDLFSIVKDKSITDYLPPERICQSAPATHLVILERGSPGVRQESNETALRKILNLNRAEFNYQRSLINNAYEFFNPELDISGACAAEHLVLRRLVDSAGECLLIQANDPRRYADLIFQAIT